MKTTYSAAGLALVMGIAGVYSVFAQPPGIEPGGPPPEALMRAAPAPVAPSGPWGADNPEAPPPEALMRAGSADNAPAGPPGLGNPNGPPPGAFPGAPPPATRPAKPATDLAPPDIGGHGLRLSALIKAGDIVKAGIINTRDGRHKFLSEGQTFYDMLVVDADYDEERVILEAEDGEIITLTLADDPYAIRGAPNYEPIDLNTIWKGEGIEAFLREHPDAIVKAGPSLKSLGYTPGPPVEGLGPGIEAFIKDDAERERLMRPAVGRGEGIESYLREHPELEAQLNQPVTGLGPGIEAYLDENPELRAQMSNQSSSASSGLGPGIEAMRERMEAEGTLPKPSAE